MVLNITNKKTSKKTDLLIHFPKSKNALIIFTRNPTLGKVKTRLAATVGKETALEIYKFLISHIVEVSEKVSADKYVFYSEIIQENDAWNATVFRKKTQKGSNLGERMHNAFQELFSIGYQKIIIVGSDIYELTTKDIEIAFQVLKTEDVVIGPAKDGGYYLLGMKQLYSDIFKNKKWGTSTVFKETISDLQNQKVSLLPLKNDVDIYEDIKDITIFQNFLKK